MASITATATTGDDETTLHGLTSEQFQTLKENAIAAKAHAYCPYSSFAVGACVLVTAGANDGDGDGDGDGGGYVSGANVENAAYPVGICAERTAFAKAVTAGHRGFRAVAVATNAPAPASPCGMCRQFMREFCALNVPVFMFDRAGCCRVLTMGELLPMGFGPEDLGKGKEG
ncbi:MAG: hypothetical protein M1840_003939 [Geoglossum simile]|nr:MAG: hypothetical protein M1840_003939 [Geoglossum simile]